MPRSNAAEAMPGPEKPEEEEEIELSEEDIEIIEDEGSSSEKAEAKKEQERIKRRKNMNELRRKLADIKIEREAGDAEVRESLEEIRHKTPEEKAKEAEEEAGTVEELKELAKPTLEAEETRQRAETETAEREVRAYDESIAEGSKNKVQMKVEEAKFLDLPGFDTEGYEQALYKVSNLEDEIENAGFFKKFALKRKLKKAREELGSYEDQLQEEKAQMNVERMRREAGVEPLSEEEKEERDKGKRQASRWGMSGGPKY